jgi:hypothetical protein
MSKNSLDAPYGRDIYIKAPWGTMENAKIFSIRDWNGKSEYVCIMNPIGNKSVRCSVFKI